MFRYKYSICNTEDDRILAYFYDVEGLSGENQISVEDETFHLFKLSNCFIVEPKLRKMLNTGFYPYELDRITIKMLDDKKQVMAVYEETI